MTSPARRRHKFLMRIHEQTNGEVYKRLDVVETGDAIGLTPEEAKAVARHFHQMGWVKFEQSGDRCWVSLTAQGVEKAEDLGQTWWRQLLTDNSFRVSVIVVVLAAVLTALCTELFRWLFSQ